MNRIFTLIIIGILFSSAIWVLPSKVRAEQSLEALVNGGFESGDLTGWSVDLSEGGSVAVVTMNPHSGQYCACITGLGILTQTFHGIPTSSIRSITVWERTDDSNYLQTVELFYSDGVDELYGEITNSWSLFDLTSQLEKGKVLVGIFLGGWTRLNGNETIHENKYFDDLSILCTPPANQSSSSIVVSCLPNPVSIGQPVTCTASVSGSNPTGAVTWSTSSSTGSFNQLVCTLSNGTCSTTYTDSNPGSVTIAACYSGDSNNAPSSGSTTLTVTSGGSVYYSSNYTSVQAAIDAAPPGTTVIVVPSFYSESLTLNKTLTIVGEKDPPVFSGGASGIYLTLLSGASGSTVTGIEITNFNEGILVSNASNCRIYSNIMTSIGSNGILLEGNNTTNNLIYGNIFQDVPTPINLTASAGNNTIYGNIISSQATVTLNVEADGNSIYGNSISANQILLNMTNSDSNTVYHNNFLTATQITVLATGNNTFDNGSLSGGNYWSIAPRFVGGKKDSYPLTKPWPLASGHCVGIISVVTAKTVFGLGSSGNVTVNVADKGEYTETFNVTTYANTTNIGTQLVNSLNATCEAILTFAWNTSGLTYGGFTISAHVQPVAGQNDTSGNDFVLGTVKITVPGDINGDFKVSLADLVMLAQAYGSKPNGANWNANADLDNNGIVGLSDLVLLARHYGQHYP
jgi:hypothetical protein